MKKLIVDDEQDGIIALLGERVQVWCLNYIYDGTLVGVAHDSLRLDDARVVYETGPLDSKPKDAQALPHHAYIRLACVEMVTKAN